MRKKYSIFILLFFLFASCDDDDAAPVLNALPDTDNPVVEISSPSDNSNFILIDVIAVNAKVTDNKRLEVVRFFLTDPSGVRKMAFEEKDIFNMFREYNISIPLTKDAPAGDYTVTVEATDFGKNVTQKSINIIIDAPALGLPEFTTAFTLGDIIRVLDWYGYQPNDRIEFNRVWFNLSFNIMMNNDQEIRISEAEWKQFAADFEVEDHSWSSWDENSDGQLDDAEFDYAFNSLQFFEEWDTDKNGIIRKDEMAKGFFNRWDQNKDGMLSREEYHEKFYIYLVE